MVLVYEIWELVSQLGWEGLEYSADDQNGGTNQDAVGVLLTSKWGSVDELSAVLNEAELDGNNGTNNNKEDPVGNEAVEDVPLGSTNLSAVELVEDVHPYE